MWGEKQDRRNDFSQADFGRKGMVLELEGVAEDSLQLLTAAQAACFWSCQQWQKLLDHVVSWWWEKLQLFISSVLQCGSGVETQSGVCFFGPPNDFVNYLYSY